MESKVKDRLAGFDDRSALAAVPLRRHAVEAASENPLPQLLLGFLDYNLRV
ncbi:hypothetical protein [Pacificimonas flava]|uniref:Uncharacterized protein n=1 Tax=Pacificimonas flava TaxID=1234595 RepID=M2U1F0_9SPHN|nr:hypothetical protein [Pacificimonas flava]EMD81663.1 hypothetical protein C725_2947 [Pacificimonas flava]MBB5281754.1 hypothetical protein [Pacificimonas flava]